MIHSYQLTGEAFAFIISETACHFPQETGGILVGRVEGDCAFIQHATGPGPHANHALTKFKRDGHYSQEVLNKLIQDSSGTLDYIGEWHSHPVKSNPSSVDITSMKWIAGNPQYAVTEPIMLLCYGSGLNRWELQCYALLKNKLRLLKSVT